MQEVYVETIFGRYAIDYYLPHMKRHSMTQIIAGWRDFLPEYFVLPHPSWHTIHWSRDHPWFESVTLPELRAEIGRVLNSTPRSFPCPRR